MKYFCCDLRRLEVIKRTGTANAIEYVEVLDTLEPAPLLRQRTLFVRLLRPGFALGAENVLIDGGARIATVPVEWVAAADSLASVTNPPPVDSIDAADLARTLVVRTVEAGDFSRYTLHLRAGADTDGPPDGFDPRLSEIDFSFKVECPSDFDCADSQACPPRSSAKPDIDYLVKDYTGFRRLMLDRLNLLAPDWSERSAADVGVALIELVAYAADNLSYRQDAIANEAYLATAHKRVSVRRHARLVDYSLHDGCNARAWVHVAVDGHHKIPKGTAMLTRSDTLPVRVAPDSNELRDALAGGAAVFETTHEADLFNNLNELWFYTWGDLGCCLPRGAKSATLRGAHPRLKKNDVLVFQELRSPTTFQEKDADPAKRWAVRLTDVKASVDPSGGLFETPPVHAPFPITEIVWDAADALPFSLCVSVQERPGLKISGALGNIVLVDHGQTIYNEPLGIVPGSPLEAVPPTSDTHSCNRAQTVPIAARFRPALQSAPVTQAFDLEAELDVPLPTNAEDDQGWWSASALIARDPHDALPAIAELTGNVAGVVSHWLPRRDLLASDVDDTHFVLETDNDGTARVRFGDDEHGRRPQPGTDSHPHRFSATYRVGNGTSGNVGAEAIAHIVTNVSGTFNAVINPMPAAGGIDPEDIEAARRDVPEAFRTQERAVTAADYAMAAERSADVQRAAARFRWTGSWYTVFVTADRFGGAAVDPRFEARLRRRLERFRMAGYDLEVDSPQYVALDITLHICVKRDYLRSEVLRAVKAELGSGLTADRRLAVFHPDNLSFGETVYLSRVVAAAQAVPGVEAVWPQKFQRMSAPDPASLENGMIPLGRLEVAQLANDPNFPERGRLMLEPGGGK